MISACYANAAQAQNGPPGPPGRTRPQGPPGAGGEDASDPASVPSAARNAVKRLAPKTIAKLGAVASGAPTGLYSIYDDEGGELPSRTTRLLDLHVVGRLKQPGATELRCWRYLSVPAYLNQLKLTAIRVSTLSNQAAL